MPLLKHEGNSKHIIMKYKFKTGALTWRKIRIAHTKYQKQTLKKFHRHHLWILAKRWCICPWQVFPAQSNVWWYCQSLLNWNTFQVLPSWGGSWPYPQTLDYSGIAYQGQSLLQTLINYGHKSLIILYTGCKMIFKKVFSPEWFCPSCHHIIF